MNLSIFILAAFFLGPSLAAKDYSVQELVDLAALKSRQVEVSGFEIKAREKEVIQTAVSENPSLEVGLENKTEPGGETRRWKVGVSQAISTSNKYAVRAEVATVDVQIAKAERDAVEIALRHAVFEKIYLYLASAEKAKHAEERLSRFRDVQKFLRSRTFASPQKRTEAGIVSGKLMVLEKDLLKLKSEVEIYWEDLNRLTKLESRPLISVKWYRRGKQISFSDLQEKLEGSSVMRRQRLIAMKSDKQLILARKEAWPALTLSGGYAEASGFAPEKSVGVGLSVPVAIFNSNRAGIEASDLRKQGESAKLEFEREKVLLGIKTLQLKYESARRAIEQLPMGRILEIEKGMSLSDEAFRKGQLDLLTYIEADSQHSASVDAILDAQTEYVAHLSQLLLLVGEATLPTEN